MDGRLPPVLTENLVRVYPDKRGRFLKDTLNFGGCIAAVEVDG
jgi:hypothetical protein